MKAPDRAPNSSGMGAFIIMSLDLQQGFFLSPLHHGCDIAWACGHC